MLYQSDSDIQTFDEATESLKRLKSVRLVYFNKSV